jgi:sulfite reductase alpha subunit-like flavoprotein
MATLYVLYGSATGNAEGIAKDMAEKTPPDHFSSIVCKPMDGFKKFLSEWSQPPSTGGKHGIIFITSTTGNGDAPENAGRFVRYIKRKQTAESLPFQHCAFSVLGLGDTNYDQFCAVGKLVDKKMIELGGTRAKDTACADEATGLEDVVEPWLDTVFSDIQKACVAVAGAPASESEKDLSTKETTSTPAPTEQQKSQIVAGAPASESEKDLSTKETISTPAAPTEQQKSQIAQSTLTKTEPQSVISTAIAPSKSEFPLFILYGSATGNAEQIAKDLAANYEMLLSNPDAKTFFPSVVCCELDLFKRKCAPTWEQEPPSGTKHAVLIVVSTTGNGDAPENAGRFIRYVKRKQTADAQPFRHVLYAILGLGDTNYDQFCNTGKIMDKKIAELGGTRARRLACADEATGLEEVVEPWTDSILAEITNACRGRANVENTQPQPHPSSASSAKINANDNIEEEEKKTEMSEKALDVDSVSLGVRTARSLLSLEPDTPIPQVEHSSLPSLGGSRSSCEFFNEEDNDQQARRNSSFDDRATISTSSSGTLHYTINSPFESTILSARYLTKTSTQGAAQVCEIIGPDGISSVNDNLLARELLDSHFPLQGCESTAAERNGKRVMEITLSLPDDYTLEYQPGDALGLIVTNTPDAVAFVVRMLLDHHGILPTQKVSIDSSNPVSVEEAAREHFDLSSPIKNKRVLHSLSQFATDQEEVATLRLMSSKTGEGDRLFKDFIVQQRRSVVDILREFPSCQCIPLEGLLTILPSIPARYYSVSSSPLDKKGGALSLTIAFSVVDYLTPSLVVDGKEQGHRRVRGIATGYLEALCSSFFCNSATLVAPSVRVFPKPTAEFRLPSNLATPIILVGPGTGIAPFMGFLEHRRALLTSKESTNAANTVVEGTWRGDYELEAEDLPIGDKDASGLSVGADYRSQQEIGDVDVFFGCRHADHDWLYEDEMKTLQNEKIISNLYSAFSRDTTQRQYVQDIMKSNPGCGERLVDIIMNKNGSIYICGDGNRMARDVQNVIAGLIGQHLGGESATEMNEKGKSVIEDMKTKGRFLLDIWS